MITLQQLFLVRITQLNTYFAQPHHCYSQECLALRHIRTGLYRPNPLSELGKRQAQLLLTSISQISKSDSL